MNSDVDVIARVGLDQRTRKSHWPARLDFVQSASGLYLGLFMWGHMAFVSTILISNDAMWWVTKMFEGQRQHHLLGLVGRAVRAERDGAGAGLQSAPIDQHHD